MKKIISFVLVLSMLLSLSACGKAASFMGDKVNVTVQGGGNKPLKVKLKDVFDEVCTIEENFPNEDGRRIIISGGAVSVEEHTASYELSALSEGSANISLSYVAPDKSIKSVVSMDIEVNADMNIAYGNVLIRKPSLMESFGGYEGAQIIDAEGGSKTLQLSNKNGEWDAGSYDKKIIEVQGPENDGSKSTFVISSVSTGKSLLELICKDARLKLVLGFEVTENPQALISSAAAESEAVSDKYILTMVSSYSEEYVPSTSEETKEIIAKAEENLSVLQIPDGFYIEDASYYEAKDGSEKSGKNKSSKITANAIEDKLNGELVVDSREDVSDNNVIEMVFTYNGVVMDYCSTSKLDARTMKTATVEGEGIVITEEKTIEGGGIKADYCYLKDGCAVAFWDGEKSSSRITFITENKSSADFEEILKILLDAQALE